ncbi:MAG: AAA family ATPase [Spirochaetaceae bacterium]|nr:AAA family ATPase [Spirochaetaceae bacterium]
MSTFISSGDEARSAVARRRLPIGMQTFRTVREEDCYYVDKTPYIARLLDEGRHYFLSRPRRFGKSLFLDTLKELFEGNEELFTGLHIHDRGDRFTFVTGVSKFSKVSLFSDLNNLTDITLDPAYSAICGYTEGDLETVFAPELAGLDRERVREWYNGYNWLGAESVYNPYDVLLLLRRRKFGAHWFETGTPAFLVDTLFERRIASVSLDEMLGTEDLLSAFDVGSIGTEALLFQTGYLTIMGEEELGGMELYRLGYPNREVRQSLNAAPSGAGREAADGQQHASRAAAGGARLHGAEGIVPRLFREYSVPEVCRRQLSADQQPDRRRRRLLRKRGLLLLRGAGLRDRGGGIEQSRAAGHGGAHRRPRVPVRVQGRGDGAAGCRAGAIARARVRGQVPGRRRTDPPHRRGVQPRDAQRDRVRGGGRLKA